ncbi:dual specificity protein phosphatase 19-like [Oratosquilla oratoria]|uniref:dual specificity protein phosphatase 19-like n=1 Tax=Oratosquilla oratoria TaxID=337810 RepID=UPI003F76802D
MSSLANQLALKKGNLKHTVTQVKTPNGNIVVEEQMSDGMRLVQSIKEQHPGFVVDTKPDLRYSHILPKLILSSQDVAHDLDLLTRIKVTHILNVASGVLNLFEGWFTYKTVEVYDTPECRISNVFEECINFIHEAILGGGCILVHCNAGVSRAASIVIAYLMKFYGMKYEEAFSHVKNKRGFIRPNIGFIAQLKEYERTIMS